MNRGYIKLWRKSMESTIFAKAGLWKLFGLCMMKASHKEIEIPITGVLAPIKIFPGQFITGRYALHADSHQAHLKKRYNPKAKPSATTLFRWLQALQSMQILDIKSSNKYTIITICNWNKYQVNDHQVNIKRSSRRSSCDSRSTRPRPRS